MIVVDLLLLSSLGTSGTTLAAANHGVGHVNLMLLRPVGIFLTDWFVILDLVPEELDVLLVLVTPVGAVVFLMLDCRSMLLFGWRDHVADWLHGLALHGFIFGFSFLEHHFSAKANPILCARGSGWKWQGIITSAENTATEAKEGERSNRREKNWFGELLLLLLL